MGKRSRQKRQREQATATSPATPSVLSPQSSVLTAWILAAIIAAATLIVYAQVRSHAYINFDDPDYVTNNEHVATGLSWANVVWAFTSVHSSNWHPLTWISHMVDVQLFGLDAGKQLLVNVVIHIINSILLLFLLRRATGRVWPSAVVAALFALHPLHVESVAWISERKDVLSAFFFFLAIWFYLGNRVIPREDAGSPSPVAGDSAPSRRGMTRYDWLTLVAFICGVMAKPMVITLPFVLLLIDWWPLRRWSLRELPTLKALAIEKWPLFLVIPLSAIATIRAQQEAITGLGLPFRIANAILAYVRYLGKAIVPRGLSIMYPFRAVISPTGTILALLLLAAITIAVLRVADRFPYLAVGWLWYLGTLVPAIGVIQVGQQAMADRYTYIPLVGIFIAVVWFLADVVRQRAVVAALAVIVIAAFAAVAYLQIGVWRDSMALFTHAVEVEPRGGISHINLGAAYLDKSDYSDAAEQFRDAVAISDRDALAHNGLGLALAGLGDPNGAQREYDRALELSPNNADALRNLGRLSLTAGNSARAIELLTKSQSIKSDDVTAASLAAARGDLDGAIAAYRRAVARHPDSAELHNDLGAALGRKGDDSGALAEYQEALRIAPNSYDTQMNAGAILARQGHNDEAMSHFETAAKLRPKSPEPHVYLALMYGNANRFAEAVAEVRAAAAIDPEMANAQFSNAVHMEIRPTNLSEYLGALERKAAGRG